MSALREALEDAFDQHEEAASTDTTETKVSGTESANDTIVDDTAPVEADKPGAEAPPKLGPRGRQADGKFTKKDTPDANTLPADVPQGQKAQVDTPKPAVAVPSARAPVSWRPDIREKFGALPKEVQEEVFRREREITTTMEQTAQARNYAQSLSQVISPYEAMIRAEGGNHVTAVDALLKTAYHLRTANPQTKAMMVAQMIMQHGVDVNLLDQAMSVQLQGRQQAPQNDPMMQYIQQQLQPVQQFVSQLQNRQQQLSVEQGHQVVNELETFAADPKNEYFHDVKGIMADFLDSASAQGQKMSLQDAYTRATLAHPTISQTVMNRQISARAAQQTAATRRARNASASLPSGGAPAGAADVQRPKGIRSAIEAAWDRVENSDSN